MSHAKRTHVAIVRREYIDALLAGTKRIEARLQRARQAPFGRVRAGDIVYLKERGGPFRGRAVVESVRDFQGLTPHAVRLIRRRFDAFIRADAAYWESKADARCASLIWMTRIRPTRSGPNYRATPGFSPRRAWHTLGG